MSTEPLTNLIGTRVAIVRTIDNKAKAFGVLRGIVPVDRYNLTYLIQLDQPDAISGHPTAADTRALYRIVEIGNCNESEYVMIDKHHPQQNESETT